MRFVSTVFVLSFALLAGCGGCDSCFSTRPSDDPVPSASPEPRAPIIVEAAARVVTEDDAGRDAASAEVDASPQPTSVPRPRAPMPLGAFESCGVYDGPLCAKKCPKGACRQECDGVDCVLSCNAGYCSQLCGPTGKCRLTCNGGHCVQVCAKPEDCAKECAGGSCQ